MLPHRSEDANVRLGGVARGLLLSEAIHSVAMEHGYCGCRVCCAAEGDEDATAELYADAAGNENDRA